MVSNVCGCLDLLRHRSPERLGANVLVANYIGLPRAVTAEQALKLSTADRDAVEAAEGKRLAGELAGRLPHDDAGMAAMLQSGWELAAKLDWERVVSEIFLPAVRRTCRQDELGRNQG